MHPTHVEFDTILNHFLGERIAGRPKQEPYIESLLQNYKIGSRLQTEDGLVWHYGQAGATGITAAYRRRGAASTIDGRSVTNFKTLGNTPIGSYTIVLTTANLYAVDYWAGGLASIFPTGVAGDYSNDNPRMIKSSTAGDGTSITLTLYQPLTYAAIIPTVQDVYCCRSPYASVDEAVSVPTGDCSIVGFSWMPVTAYYYFWAQTWGLCQPVGTGGDMGIAAGSREIVFNYGDGTIRSAVAGGAYGTHQRAGYLVPRTILAGGGDEAFIMLQLDP